MEAGEKVALAQDTSVDWPRREKIFKSGKGFISTWILVYSIWLGSNDLCSRGITMIIYYYALKTNCCNEHLVTH